MRNVWIGAALAGLVTVPAAAQLVPVKNLSTDMTLTLMTTAAKCAKSDRVTVAIVDRNQVVLATFRGPLATLNTVDLARRKAASAAQFGRATGAAPPGGAAPGGGRGAAPGGAGAPGGGAPAAPQTEAQMLEALTQMVRTMNGQVNNIANNESGLGGAEPIKVGDETIAAIGLSGSGPTEGPCAREAIAAIQDQLK